MRSFIALCMCMMVSAAATLVAKNQEGESNMKTNPSAQTMKRSSDWSESKEGVKIHAPTKTAVARALKADFTTQSPGINGKPEPVNIPIIAFSDDKAGAAWVGLSTDFYVFDGDSTVGVSLPPFSPNLHWYKSAASKKKGHTPEALAKSFETKTVNEDFLRPAKITEIGNAVSWDLFKAPGTSYIGNQAKITDVARKGNKLSLQISGVSTNRATVVVDIKSKKVVDAFLNGKKVKVK